MREVKKIMRVYTIIRERKNTFDECSILSVSSLEFLGLDKQDALI